VVDRQCAGDPARLDEVAHAPGLTAELRAYVEDATFCTNNAGLAAWGVAHCYQYGFTVPGIRGAYYEGANFEKAVFERIDEKLDFGGGQFGYADKRDSDLSVRWTAKLTVARSGRYTFRIPCDDGYRLTLDGTLVSDVWDAVRETRTDVDLSAGAHDFQLEYKACPPPNHLRVFWTGPDGVEKILSKENLRAVPLAKR
jgi:hypothetical protein